MVANGPREPGVGAELTSPESSLSYEDQMNKVSIVRLNSIASSSEPDIDDRAKDFDVRFYNFYITFYESYIYSTFRTFVNFNNASINSAVDRSTVANPSQASGNWNCKLVWKN